MRRSQITYIKQKLMRLSKEDLTEFAKFTNTWIRPYWPKSEIAEAIISGEKENVVLKLKAWAKRVGKEQLILGSEPDPFWEQKPRGKPVPEDDSKTFSEEFLERWKKLSSKEEERPSEVAIKKPPRMMPRLPERRDDRISEISVSQDIENLREKLKEKFDEKSKIPKRPPGRPKESPRGRPMGRPVERPTGMPKDRIHIRQPRGLERRGPPLKKTDGLVEPEPGRYTPFKSQLENLKARIVDRVQDIKDQDKLIKEELLKETEELDAFMTKEFEEKGIKVDEKIPDFFKKEKRPDIDKKDFDQHLKDLEDKLIVKELQPPTLKTRVIRKDDEMEEPTSRPLIDELKSIPQRRKYDIHTDKMIGKDEEKKEEMELRSKFFDKYIKRTLTEEDEGLIELEAEDEDIEAPPVTIRRPPKSSIKRDLLGGRVNGRGLINGVVYRKGLVNGYSSGLVNGRVNGKGLINGMMVERTSDEENVKMKIRRIGLIRSRFRRRIVVTGIVILALLILPILAFMIPVPEGKDIQIDGVFDDWQDLDVLTYTDSETDQLVNENVNLVEFKISEKENKISTYMKTSDTILSGRDVDDGYGMDMARVFIDFDGENTTGYMVNDIGSEYMFEISGFNNYVTKAEVYKYPDTPNSAHDWNSWTFLSRIFAEANDNELEAQYWFTDQLNLTDKVKAHYVLLDSQGNIDPGDSVISNKPEGSLLIKQSKVIEEDVLDSGYKEVLKLEFNAYGAPVIVESVNFEFDNGDLEYTISDLKIPAGETRTEIVSLRTSYISENTLLEIGLTDHTQVQASTDVVTIVGLPARYFVHNAPDEFAIDGAFADWQDTEVRIDVDQSVVSNDNIDLNKYKFNRNNESIFVYFEVTGTIMAGTLAPESASFFYPQVEEMDSDNDGVPDSIDPHPFENIQSDNDTISDDYENVFLHTDPYNDDTDGDGFWDHLDPSPRNPFIPPIPEVPPPEALLGKDTAKIFIDTDQNQDTGYRLFNTDMGADYVVEISGKYQFILEKTVSRFNGNDQYSWNWTPVGSVEVGIDSFRLESAIDLGLLGLNPGDGFQLFYVISDWSEHKDEINDTFGYVPTGTLRVIGEDISPGTRVRNNDIVSMLKLTFITDQPQVRIYSIYPTLLGTYETSDIVSVVIIEDDGDGIPTNEDLEVIKTRTGSSRGTRISMKFQENIELQPDLEKSFFLAVETNLTVQEGSTIGMELNSIEDIGTNVKQIVGNFPMSSNLYSLEMTSSRAPPTFVNLDLNTTYSGPSEATQGDTGILVLSFTMTASNGDATIYSIDLTHTGNGPSNDITSLYLKGPMGNLSGGFGTYSFTPFQINEDTTVTFYVYVDVSSTATVGKTHGVRVNSVGVDSGTKVRGQAKSSERMEILAIPEIPDELMPVLAMGVIFLISFARIKIKEKKY